uniref:Uncharacterized protein n=1 Tax=Zea mays TaxID=4577 RepID=A0A804M0Y5_MAIZE
MYLPTTPGSFPISNGGASGDDASPLAVQRSPRRGVHRAPGVEARHHRGPQEPDRRLVRALRVQLHRRLLHGGAGRPAHPDRRRNRPQPRPHRRVPPRPHRPPGRRRAHPPQLQPLPRHAAAVHAAHAPPLRARRQQQPLLRRVPVVPHLAAVAQVPGPALQQLRRGPARRRVRAAAQPGRTVCQQQPLQRDPVVAEPDQLHGVGHRARQHRAHRLPAAEHRRHGRHAGGAHPPQHQHQLLHPAGDRQAQEAQGAGPQPQRARRGAAGERRRHGEPGGAQRGLQPAVRRGAGEHLPAAEAQEPDRRRQLLLRRAGVVPPRAPARRPDELHPRVAPPAHARGVHRLRAPPAGALRRQRLHCSSPAVKLRHTHTHACMAIHACGFYRNGDGLSATKKWYLL